jgi:polysaccharide pyruvyl transferase WcaK-like protein
VRDKYSLVELEKLGITIENVRFTYESVFGFGGKLGYISKPSDRLPIVGISVYSVQVRSVKEHNRYINALREVIDHITSAGYRVKFFPMQLRDEPGDDMPCIQAILKSVQQPGQCSVYDGTVSMFDHIKEVAKCRFFIGHKTHSVIIALVTGTPVLAIAYHPKTTEFMKQISILTNCIDDSLLEGELLIEMFNRIELEIDSIGEKQLEGSVKFGEIVRRDFSHIFK